MIKCGELPFNPVRSWERKESFLQIATMIESFVHGNYDNDLNNVEVVREKGCNL